ncbi:MAG TPA: SigE family RNA polymerase sigma factor [Streptosporangiaceae bacterium]|nr:SigE family RNA polymerase sigma factor [Streptosporangiaceae bacterium]
MSFEEFLAARLPALLRYTTALTGDPHLAEDMVQECLVRVDRKWRKIRELDAPEQYVKRMITNEYLSWRRKRSSGESPVTDDRLGAAMAPLTDPSQSYDDRDAVWTRIAALPRRQRAVLALRFYEGLSTAEIAEVLGCSEGTVRSHVSRALAELRLDLRTEAAPRESR